ncbi:hypothetical protein GCK32_017248 [Trichostrongylus colubriformis]|uniref:Peptidase S1 domain-containing protein n=1 Tax=Trichostrongylus colubriformis TaxID=6319 RepID=A0AAN8IG67_TRICO
MPLCSAVQISRRHILTAAHCVLDSNLDDDQRNAVCDSLRCRNIKPQSKLNLFYKNFKHIEAYATSNLTGRLHYRDLGDSIKLEIEGHPYVHKEYDPCTSDNDLAIIELKSDVPREVGSPICMRENEKLAGKLSSAGYGRDPKSPDANDEFHWLQKVDFDSKDVTESATTITAAVHGKSLCPKDIVILST